MHAILLIVVSANSQFELDLMVTLLVGNDRPKNNNEYSGF